MTLDVRSLCVMLAWNSGYIKVRQAARLMGFDPDAGGVRAQLRLRREALEQALGRPLPRLAGEEEEPAA